MNVNAAKRGFIFVLNSILCGFLWFPVMNLYVNKFVIKKRSYNQISSRLFLTKLRINISTKHKKQCVDANVAVVYFHLMARYRHLNIFCCCSYLFTSKNKIDFIIDFHLTLRAARSLFGSGIFRVFSNR